MYQAFEKGKHLGLSIESFKQFVRSLLAMNVIIKVSYHV